MMACQPRRANYPRRTLSYIGPRNSRTSPLTSLSSESNQPQDQPVLRSLRNCGPVSSFRALPNSHTPFCMTTPCLSKLSRIWKAQSQSTNLVWLWDFWTKGLWDFRTKRFQLQNNYANMSIGKPESLSLLFKTETSSESSSKHISPQLHIYLSICDSRLITCSEGPTFKPTSPLIPNSKIS